MALPVGATFFQRYLGTIPAGWEVVQTFDNGLLIKRVLDLRTGELA